jgi:hypothetical protein
MLLNDLVRVARIEALRHVSGGDPIRTGVDDRVVDSRQAPIGGVNTGPLPSDGWKMIVTLPQFKTKNDIVKLVDEQVMRHAVRVRNEPTRWCTNSVLDALIWPANKDA